MMQLILVRHAQPQRIEKSDGPADPPLTAFGIRQARAMAQCLGGEQIEALYVSPMLRARQTCAPLERTTGLRPTVVDGVREFDAEEKSYIPIEDHKADPVRWKEYLRRHSAADRSQFQNKVVAGLEGVIADNQGATVVVVCHGGVINAWAARVLDHPRVLFFEPHYVSISRFAAARSGERSIVSLNESAHVRGLAT